MLYPCGIHDSDLLPGGPGDPCDFLPPWLKPVPEPEEPVDPPAEEPTDPPPDEGAT